MNETGVNAVRVRLKAIERALASVPETAPWLDRVAAIRASLDAQPVLFVAGMFGAGKSSVINALLGDEVAPSRPEPTTAVVTQFNHGEPGARLYFCDDRPATDVTIDRWRQLVDQTHLENHPHDRETAAALDNVDVWHPSPLLRDVSIVDAPGFNSPHAEHDARTRSHIGRADLVLWVSQAPSSGSATEIDALEEARRLASVPMIAFLNAMDLVPGSEREAVRSRFARVTRLGESCVLLYSAKRRLAGSGGADDAVINGAEAALHEFVERQGSSAQANRSRKASKALASDIRSELKRRAGELTALVDRIGEAWKAFSSEVMREAERAARDRAKQAVARLEREALDAALHLKECVGRQQDRVWFLVVKERFAFNRPKMESYHHLAKCLRTIADESFGDYLESMSTTACELARHHNSGTILADVFNALGESQLEQGPQGLTDEIVRSSFLSEALHFREDVRGREQWLKGQLGDGTLPNLLDVFFPTAMYAKNIPDGRQRDIYHAQARDIVEVAKRAAPSPFSIDEWVQPITAARGGFRAALRTLKTFYVDPLVEDIRSRSETLNAAARTLA